MSHPTPAEGEHDTAASVPPPASLAAVLGKHTSSPPRRRQVLRFLVPLLCLVLAAYYIRETLWLLAACLVIVGVANLLPARDRYRGAHTEVTEDGLRVHAARAGRSFHWAEVQEIYPRTAWASYSTLRTAGGSTVALPGVSDEAAELLERARADTAKAAG